MRDRIVHSLCQVVEPAHGDLENAPAREPTGRWTEYRLLDTGRRELAECPGDLVCVFDLPEEPQGHVPLSPDGPPETRDVWTRKARYQVDHVIRRPYGDE